MSAQNKTQPGKRNYDHPSIASQVARIRAEIEQHGESQVGCDDLKLLCATEASTIEGLTGVAQIAQWENWTFEYMPDGTVRFSKPPAKIAVDRS